MEKSSLEGGKETVTPTAIAKIAITLTVGQRVF